MSTGTPKRISIHQRAYTTEAFDVGDGKMQVVGRLIDTKPQGLGLADGEPLTIHDMEIALTIEAATFKIEAVETTMHVHPYDQCPGILSSYDQLVGESIARGYSRKIKDLFGGPNGCSHVGALLIAMGPVAIQASWSYHELDEPIIDPNEVDLGHIETQLRMNTNTCHIWSSDGTQIAMLERGERPERPRWQTQRLNKLLDGI